MSDRPSGGAATRTNIIGDGLRDVVVTRDGSQIITGGGDGSVQIWDRVTGAPVGNPMTDHAGAVLSVAVTPDSTQIITGRSDGTVLVWNRGTRTPDGDPLSGHTGAVKSVAVTPDGTQVVTGSNDGTVLVWDWLTRTPDGDPLAGHTGAVNSVAVTPDGTQVVTGSNDGTVRVWDRETRKPAGDPLTGHASAVCAVAVTPDGSQILTGSNDGAVRVWDRETRKPVGNPLTGHTGAVFAVAVTPDGSQSITCSDFERVPRVWSLVPPPNRVIARTSTAVRGLAVTPDGTQIITGNGSDAVIDYDNDNTVRVWDRATGAMVGAPLTGHTGPVYAVAVTPDGAQIVSGGGARDGTVRVWDRETGTPVRPPLEGHGGPVFAVAMTPDGSQIISGGGGSDPAVRVWDRGTGSSAGGPLTGHTGLVFAVAVTPDGSQIISCCGDGAVRVWDRATGALDMGPLIDRTGALFAVAVTPDGTQIITGGEDGAVRAWDRTTGELAGAPLVGHPGPVFAVAVTPDGTQIIAGGAGDWTVRIWDRATQTSVGAPLVGHTGTVFAIAVTPDGSQIITGGDDGTVRVWQRPESPRPAERATEILTDAEARDDRLGIAADVGVLAALLVSTSTKPPLSIALMGDWGSGKSTFMTHLKRHVAELARHAAVDPPVYVRNVRQVRFNAWHYSDDHLWVGLVEQIFRELRDNPATATPPPPDANELINKRATLDRDIAELDRQDRALAAINDTDPDRGWWGWLGQIRRGWLVAREAGRDATRELRRRTVRAAIPWAVAALLAVVAVVLVAYFVAPSVAPAASGLVALLSGPTVLIGAIVTQLRTVWRTAREQSAAARDRLLASRRDTDERITQTRARLRELDPSLRFADLLAEITVDDRYQTYRGLTGRIHDDLQRLSDQLAATTAADPAQAWRLILYVDDLDRCLPARVAEVLQAVNLLMSMPLFQVVVAVDPRWLLRALAEHHGYLLTRPDALDNTGSPDRSTEDPGDGVADSAQRAGTGGALDYLDKIFHLPYAMRPMQHHARDMLRDLLPDTESAPDEQSTGSDTPPGTGSTDAGTDSASPTRTRQPATGPPAPSPADPDVDIPRSAGSDDRPLQMIRGGGVTTEPSDDPDTAPVTLARLRLHPREAEFLPELGPLLPSPRGVKKFTNLYRLLRIAVPDAEIRFFIGATSIHWSDQNSDGPGGPFQAAALLLATLISLPGAAVGLLTEIRAADPTTTITDALHTSTNSAARYLCDAIRTLQPDHHVHVATAAYQYWAPRVARYSFETYDLFITTP